MLRHTRRKVLDTALDVGYDTPSSFHRTFRRLLGTSAAEWRRRSGSGADHKGTSETLREAVEAARGEKWAAFVNRRGDTGRPPGFSAESNVHIRPRPLT